MTKLSLLTGLLMATLQANTVFALSVEEAQRVVQPFYDFLSNPGDADAADAARAALAPEWQSYYSDDGSKNVDDALKGIGGFGQLVPDLKWAIKEVRVADDTVIVRGEASGTPKGDFFGVPHTGKSFRIMSIDMHTVKDGRIIKSYHVEDWAGAARQLKPSN